MLPWFAQSADLSTIENVWLHIKNKIKNYLRGAVKNKVAFINHTFEEWGNIPMNSILNIISKNRDRGDSSLQKLRGGSSNGAVLKGK